MNDKINISTIGFTQTTAERFFGRLIAAHVLKVIDVRLHNTSQLAAFAKADDLAYFLLKLANIKYVHEPRLAPTDDMLKKYKKLGGGWQDYESEFLALLASRRIEETLAPELFEEACLLCSEAKPHHCHRRLVCDYLNGKWGGRLAVRHL